MKKVCSKCRVEKEESEFHKRRTAKDGIDIWCKSCKKEAQKHRQRCYSMRIRRKIEKMIEQKKEELK